MTITLAGEPESILEQLIAAGRFATREQAIAEALRRIWTEDEANHILPKAFTLEEVEAIYAADPGWEKVEAALAGRCAPEA